MGPVRIMKAWDNSLYYIDCFSLISVYGRPLTVSNEGQRQSLFKASVVAPALLTLNLPKGKNPAFSAKGPSASSGEAGPILLTSIPCGALRPPHYHPLRAAGITRPSSRAGRWQSLDSGGLSKPGFRSCAVQHRDAQTAYPSFPLSRGIQRSNCVTPTGPSESLDARTGGQESTTFLGVSRRDVSSSRPHLKQQPPARNR